MKAAELIAFFQQALAEIWGYIWGTWGQEWTAAKQKQKVNYMVSKYGTGWKNNSEAKEDNYYYSALYGDQWIGHKVADCSGLFRKAFSEYGIAISHSSNRIWNSYCKKQGEMNNGKRTDGGELKPGTAVFVHPEGKNRTHIGLYIGDGTVIEAASARNGVITSAITHRKWVEWGELKYVEYEGGGDEPVTKPTIRRGDNGPYVKECQNDLISLGYDVGKTGADGIFGKNTESAVVAFQANKGLKADGIVGPDTWAALDEAVGPGPAPEPGKTYMATIRGLTTAQADALKAQYPQAEITEEKNGT